MSNYTSTALKGDGQQEGGDKRCVFVINYPKAYTEADFRQVFDEFNVVSVKIHNTNDGKGFTFVTLATEQEASESIAKLRGTVLEGYTLFVFPAKSKPKSQATRNARPSSKTASHSSKGSATDYDMPPLESLPYKTVKTEDYGKVSPGSQHAYPEDRRESVSNVYLSKVIVSNFSPDSSEIDVMLLFKTFQPCSCLILVIDEMPLYRETTHAFVYFKNPVKARGAASFLNGAEVDGRIIKVQFLD